MQSSFKVKWIPHAAVEHDEIISTLVGIDSYKKARASYALLHIFIRWLRIPLLPEAYARFPSRMFLRSSTPKVGRMNNPSDTGGLHLYSTRTRFEGPPVKSRCGGAAGGNGLAALGSTLIIISTTCIHPSSCHSLAGLKFLSSPSHSSEV